MAVLFEKKDRHVLPNWRSFENTVKLGELNGSRSLEFTSSFKPDISDILEDWGEIENRNIAVAGDILGVAITCNQHDNAKVKEIANFVLQNEKFSPKAVTNPAKEILKPTHNQQVELDTHSIELFQDQTSITLIYKQINELKLKLRQNLSNSINWIEIGRLYAIIGESSKAERSVRNAVFLSPENRFILRNMTRFFTHTGGEGVEFAHNALRKSDLVKFDPWLMSAEISLATLRDRNSRFIKSGLEIVNSNKFHPFNITELASSLATVEMKNSNLTRSRKLFEQSLKRPNDNSLAQAEWASQQEKNFFLINSSQMNMAGSYEAIARDLFEKSKWDDAIEYSKKWFLDLPFSKGAILFGNNIALRKLKKHQLAIDVAKLGLISHPHDSHLLNNIMYSLCMLGKIDEAEKTFRLVDKQELTSKNIHNVCLLATLGLLNYRKGNYETGRNYYISAMNLAKETGKKNLVSSALVNMTREELIVGKENLSDAMLKIRDMLKKTDDDDLKSDINEVINLYESKK